MMIELFALLLFWAMFLARSGAVNDDVSVSGKKNERKTILEKSDALLV